jgi:hypothetical protein
VNLGTGRRSDKTSKARKEVEDEEDEFVALSGGLSS